MKFGPDQFSSLLNFLILIGIEVVLIVLLLGKTISTIIDIFVFDEPYSLGTKVIILFYLLVLSILVTLLALMIISY